MRELSGKVAVVTGAASGLGRGIAEALVREGLRVAIADVDGTRLDVEVARLGTLGGDVIGVVTDVGDPAAVEELAEQTVAHFGSVQIICNNAGVVDRGPTWERSLADWERVLRVNLWGVIHGVRTFVPIMLASGQECHVVNVGSMAAVVSVAGIAPYSVSKHGVLALSETLQMDLAAVDASIGVTVVMPGFVRTRLGNPDAEESGDLDRPRVPGEVTAADVGTIVVDAVREGRLYCFTHPDRLDAVRSRFDAIVPPA